MPIAALHMAQSGIGRLEIWWTPATMGIDRQRERTLNMTRRRQMSRAEVNPRITRHEIFDDGSRILHNGDRIKVRLPGSSTKQVATFRAYVVPDKGVPYVDIADKKGVSRCIRPEDIVSKDRRQPKGRR